MTTDIMAIYFFDFQQVKANTYSMVPAA